MDSALSSLRFLVLGAGAVVQEYYIPALYMLKLLPYTNVVDLSSDALEKIKRKFPEINIQKNDFRCVLGKEDVSSLFDAVLVALPNALHEEASLLALNHKLHVLCEKPLTLTHEGCLRLAACAETAGRVLTVGMVRRFLPSINVLRQAFCNGLIGKLVGIHIEDGEPYAWLSDTGDFFKREHGGVLVDMGVHYLDLAGEFAGELKPISYWDDRCGGVEANVVFKLQSQDGVPLCLALSRTRKLRNALTLRGTSGELVVVKGIDDSCQWHSYESGAVMRLLPVRPFSSGDWPPIFESCFVQQLYEFRESISHGNPPRVSALDAASTMSCIEWAYSQPKLAISCTEVQDAADTPMLPPGQVMVTGGTGFIGSNLVRRLCEAGFDRVVVPVRNYQTCAEAARFPINMPRLDLLNYEEIKAALKGARWVFHLAYGKDGLNASRITVEGTQYVVEAAIAAGCECVVILSSAYVFGHPGTIVDESYPYRPVGGEYGKSKARMEQWCLKRSRSSGTTRIVVLNPTCVYGPGGKTYSMMPASMAKEGTFCWVDRGEGSANYVYIENLLDALLLAATSERAHGERFIINDGTTTWREFLNPFLGAYADGLVSYTKEQLLDLHRQYKHLTLMDAVRVIVSDQRVIDALKNTFLLKVPLQLSAKYAPSMLQKVRESRFHFAGSPISNRHPLPAIWLADLFGYTRTIFSTEKAHRLFGWQPSINLTKGQELTIEWLQHINLI